MMRTTSTTRWSPSSKPTPCIEHVQDFWGDPLTEAGAQATTQGRVRAGVSQAIRVRPWPTSRSALQHRIISSGGVKVFVTGGSALAADQQIAGD
jgi:RND superfamily putative drug exporter